MMQYDIRDYGAQSDGNLCTTQIQSAIDACFVQGGGEVVIPAGTYVTGSLRLRSNVTLHLLENAVLQGSIDPEDYFAYLNDQIEPITQQDRESGAPSIRPGSAPTASVMPYSRWNNAIVRAINAENIRIIGETGSVIDGQNCFDAQGEEGYRGPHAINLWYCRDIELKGYTIKDSANWAHAIQNSQRIRMENVTVLGGHDGFNIRTCDDTWIENCVFRTGDDCIAGFDNINTTVRGCEFDSACSMLRFGGTNVLVENCTGQAPATYGHRYGLSQEEREARASADNCRHNCLNVFLYYCDNRAAVRKTPGNIVFRNCTFVNPDALMSLPFGHMWCCNRSLADVSFEDCRIEGVCLPSDLMCPEEEPLVFAMKDCVVTARKGSEGIALIEGKHVRSVRLNNVVFEGFAEEKILCEPMTEMDERKLSAI